MKKNILLIILFWIPSLGASLPEFFGASPATSSIGNQSNMLANDPSNLYYVPALSAFADRISLSASTYIIQTEFNPITNVVQQNSTNGQSGTSTTSGDVDTNYKDSYNGGVHFMFPLYNKFGSIGVSYFTALGKLTESDSGDPELPEYSLYRARYRRTQLHFNGAFPINQSWAFSLGFHLGFQASARVNTKVSLGDDVGSAGAAKTKLTPSLGAIVSVIRQTSHQQTYFTYQQEMKSNLEAIATGDITDPPLTLINVGIESMIYYDPHIFRIGQAFRLSRFDIMTSLEYQLWEKYKAPTIKVVNKGGSVRGSSNFEQLKLRNIIVPKLGMSWNAHKDLSLLLGASYRQSPFDSDFSGAGNTIDTDSYIVSSGMTYDFKFFKKDIQASFGVQYHHLVEKSVTKSAGQENGNNGQKVGAPGYKLGGHVISSQIGFNFKI
jgi:hypothetical protein